MDPTEDTAKSLPVFHAMASKMQNPFVQIPAPEYHRMVARLEIANRGTDSMKNLNTVIENLKVDLETYKDRATKYEVAFLEAELRCGQLIKSSLGKQGARFVTESIVPSISTENTSIGTEKVLAGLVSENSTLKEQLESVLQTQGSDYATFKSNKASEAVIDELRKSLQREKDKCQELESLQEMKSSDDALSQLQVQCSELTQQVWKLTKSSTAKQALITALNTEHTRVTELNNTLRIESEQLKRDHVALKSEMAKTKAEREELEAKCAQHDARMKKILAHKLSNGGSAKEREQEVELERLREKDKDNMRTISLLQKQMDTLTNENAKVQNLLTEKVAKLKTTQDKLQQFERNWESLEQMIQPPATVKPSRKLVERPLYLGQDVVADTPSASRPTQDKPRRRSRDKTESPENKCPRCFKTFKSSKDLDKHIVKCVDE